MLSQRNVSSSGRAPVWSAIWRPRSSLSKRARSSKDEPPGPPASVLSDNVLRVAKRAPRQPSAELHPRSGAARRPRDPERVEASQPILTERRVVDVSERFRRPSLAARDRTDRYGVRPERDLVAANVE